MANEQRPERPARARRRAAPPRAAASPTTLAFSLLNAALAGAGVLALGLGYWMLADGSVTAAPLLLVLGYVVLLPLALIL